MDDYAFCLVFGEDISPTVCKKRSSFEIARKAGNQKSSSSVLTIRLLFATLTGRWASIGWLFIKQRRIPSQSFLSAQFVISGLDIPKWSQQGVLNIREKQITQSIFFCVVSYSYHGVSHFRCFILYIKSSIGLIGTRVLIEHCRNKCNKSRNRLFIQSTFRICIGRESWKHQPFPMC